MERIRESPADKHVRETPQELAACNEETPGCLRKESACSGNQPAGMNRALPMSLLNPILNLNSMLIETKGTRLLRDQPLFIPISPIH
ncbi:hypothetical protein [Heyndrickxia acidicola]|uniref:Uncharacterized protein n=1 Tax=Heyndrickxia acidicola TaxID=209389 RepID=A0ABU6MB12_9BACI|nr:hypothetical protein [Heyndrickxia acidicola]